MKINMNVSIRENVPLARLTTLRIGGAARLFARANDENEVVEALKFAAENDLKVFILGGGSNVLVGDAGFDGLVLQIALKGIERARASGEKILVTAGAGEDWDDLCAVCAAENLAGIECLSGIPGLTGGTPVQNVGAYGQDVAETIVSVRVFDRKTREILRLSNADCKFAYRSSIFNTTEKNRFVVLAVTFALKPNGAPKIVYRDLRDIFGEKTPSLQETREAVLKIRRAKSMVVDESDANSKSVGSFFKNPVVNASAFAEIETRARALGIIGDGESVPSFAAGADSLKVPAAWLIERAGFEKGFRLGRAGLSKNHTLAIVNYENATARDVLDLKDLIQSTVKKKFGVELKPEPIFVGFEER